MTGPTHIAFSFAATVGLAAVTHAPPSAVAWLAIVFGSLAPDIDTKNSLIVRPGTFFNRFLPKFFVEVLNECGTIVCALVRMLCSHRGASHWPIFGVAIICAGALTELDWLAWFGWSHLMHIAADFCTKGGVPLFGPISRRPVSWSPIRTGSLSESCLQFLLWVLVFVWGYPLLPQGTLNWLSRYAEFFGKLLHALQRW